MTKVKKTTVMYYFDPKGKVITIEETTPRKAKSAKAALGDDWFLALTQQRAKLTKSGEIYKSDYTKILKQATTAYKAFKKRAKKVEVEFKGKKVTYTL